MTHNPQPPELQAKLARLGWGGWTPTPGVRDEERELYITLGTQSTHIMAVEEALRLSDEQLQQAITVKIGMSFEEAMKTYGKSDAEIIREGGIVYGESKERKWSERERHLLL